MRAHIFLCMLAYYVEWHMREAWRELMFAEWTNRLMCRFKFGGCESGQLAHGAVTMNVGLLLSDGTDSEVAQLSRKVVIAAVGRRIDFERVGAFAQYVRRNSCDEL